MDVYRRGGLGTSALRFRLYKGLRVALKPWRPMLPQGGERKSITIRHLHLRQALGVHDLVFLNYVVLVQQEGGEGVHLIRAERPSFPRGIPRLM